MESENGGFVIKLASYANTNLKKETLYIMKQHGKKKSDVKWVGCKDFRISTDDFWKMADNNYDSSYGSQKVACDLLVVGDGWWLERAEYDGSEWWEYKQYPAMPEEVREVPRVLNNYAYWPTLSELCAEAEDD